MSADLEGALQGAALALAFSTASAAPRQVDLCAAARVPLLLGTTGLGTEMGPIAAQAAERIPLLMAANTSLGATVLQELVRRAAAALGAGFDLRVQDSHHRDKTDTPSGTALALGRVAGEARGVPGDAVQYSSVRAGTWGASTWSSFWARVNACDSATRRPIGGFSPTGRSGRDFGLLARSPEFITWRIY